MANTHLNNAKPHADLLDACRDLRAEGDELYALLHDMDTGYWTQHSTFKNWTVWDVVAHLHFSDHLALTTLHSGDDFRALLARLQQLGMHDYLDEWMGGKRINGPELLQRWRTMFLELCDVLEHADPDERFVWAGPTMRARMFATARQMETWAHGWEIYDLMNLPRTHTDRILNVAEIGVRTFEWTFTNRQLEVPDPPPHVRLTAPSGATWQWHPEQPDNLIEGDAVAFCQVVTQVRNVADTALRVVGDTAAAWMSIAQCFAGPPEDPPAPGTRRPPQTA